MEITGSVLMVEPNPGILIVARNVLARAGCGVLAVSNARQGVKLAAQRDVDVLLLDAQQASVEVMTDLARARNPSMQVVLTAQMGREPPTDIQDLAQAKGREPYVILEKPFTPERLLSSVKDALEGANAVRADALSAHAALSFDDDTHDSLKTDVYPFAHLLQSDAGIDPDRDLSSLGDETRVADRLDPDGAQRAARLRTLLEREGVEPAQIPACLRACEVVLDEEQDVTANLTGGAPSPESDDWTLVVAGYVGELSIDQILQLPTAVDGAAWCRLENDQAVIDIYYEGQFVVFGKHDNLPAGFTLGRMLVAGGLVRDADVASALDPRHGLSGLLGQRLVRLGHVSEEGIQEGLRRQTEELVYEVVRWRGGRFSVFSRDELPAEARRAEVRVPVQHLLLEGMRRLDEWRRIEGEVGDLAAVLRPLEAAQTNDIVRDLSAEDRHVLSHVDGERTIADLVSSVARPSFQVFRALHSLTNQKLVAVAS